MGQAELKEFRFPTGGIADFYLEEHEKEALFKKKAEENFGNSGIANFDSVATRMASYGRYGDDKLVHAETGELVVPKALIENNPELRDSIFGHLKDMGIEDPERYVVGSRANSINPDTGLPEFFLKDIFDKVGDVIRKVAKPVLTIAGAYFLGPVYGSALGAGIGGLIQGESLEQAFGSALTAGAVGGVGSFLAGGAEGARAAFTTNPFGSETKLAQMLSTPKTMTDVTGTTTVRADLDQLRKPTVLDQAKADAGVLKDTNNALDNLMKDPRFTNPTTGKNIPISQSGFTENLRQGNFKEAFFPSKQVTALDVIRENPTMDITEATKLADAANTRGFLSRNVGNIAAGSTLAAAGGFFDAPEQEDMKLKTGADLLKEEPQAYGLTTPVPQYATGPFSIPTRFGLPQPPVQYAAQGGEAFPRRNGGIDMSEGTPGKDSVRAMLMPGEFVMTTDAVNGAGGGDNAKGIQNMYSMMRNFEARARA